MMASKCRLVQCPKTQGPGETDVMRESLLGFSGSWSFVGTEVPLTKRPPRHLSTGAPHGLVTACYGVLPPRPRPTDVKNGAKMR